ncbi:hypothetical protein CHS0354_042202 [Potamilus streckersoni]|uniref:Uncharacterized protein n=1 Tax=Potamilus streckersoni TaxID=2493646 RepID=A0AAE0WFW9_9BIVA|nr:hypothetical protein CHS0354_042202 [Potamilus streckersoni]
MHTPVEKIYSGRKHQKINQAVYQDFCPGRFVVHKPKTFAKKVSSMRVVFDGVGTPFKEGRVIF